MVRPIFTKASSLIALLFATSASSSPAGISLKNTIECVYNVLLPHSTCADPSILQAALSILSNHSTSSETLIDDVEVALMRAGCDGSPKQAEDEATWAVEQCAQQLGNANTDLRRLQRQAGKRAETTEAATHTTAKGGPKTTLVAATDEPETEAKPTTEAKPATEAQPTREAKPTTATVAPTTTAEAQTTAATTQTTQQTTTTAPTYTTSTGSLPLKPSTCFTTSMATITTCPVIPTGPSSGKTGTCFPTTTPTSVCAPGLICQYDSHGDPSCMFAQNNITVSGIIVAIIFGATVVVTMGLIIFFSRKEKMRNKAWTIANDAKMFAAKSKQTVSVEDGNDFDGTRPLMGGGTVADPFQDGRRV